MQVKMEQVGALQPAPLRADETRSGSAPDAPDSPRAGGAPAPDGGIDLEVSDRLRADLRFLQEKRAETSAAISRVGELKSEIETIRDRVHGFWNQVRDARSAAGGHLPPPFSPTPHPAYQALVDLYDDLQAVHAETTISVPGAVLSGALEGVTREVRIHREPASGELVVRTKPIETLNSSNYTAYWIAEPVTIPAVDLDRVRNAFAPYGEAVADVDRNDPSRLGSTLNRAEFERMIDTFQIANAEIRSLSSAYVLAERRLEDKLDHLTTMIVERRAELAGAAPTTPGTKSDIDPAEVAAQLRSHPALARLAQAHVQPGRAHALLSAPPPRTLAIDQRAVETENRLASNVSIEEVEAHAPSVSLTPTQLEAIQQRAHAALANSRVLARLPW